MTKPGPASAVFAIIVFGLAGATSAVAQESTQLSVGERVGAAEIPPPERLLALIRNAFAALHQANVTGNYTVLRDLGSSAFQNENSAAKLGVAFSSLREKQIDLSATMVATPQLAGAPVLGADGVLRLEGNFPTKPLSINFLVSLQAPDWRIAGITMNFSPNPEASTASPETRAPAENSQKDKAPVKKK